MSRLEAEIKEHITMMETLASQEFIQKTVERCIQTLESGNKILFCGNGGSAADAQHIAAEFVVRYQKNGAALPAIAITTDASILTACGNDFSFEEIFSRQVEAIGDEGDLYIGISTSGNSPNICRAAESATKKGLHTIAVTGAKHSRLVEISDTTMAIPSEKTARIQEGYLFVWHYICGQVEEHLR